MSSTKSLFRQPPLNQNNRYREFLRLDKHVYLSQKLRQDKYNKIDNDFENQLKFFAENASLLHEVRTISNFVNKTNGK